MYFGFYLDEMTPSGKREARGLPSLDRTADYVRGEMRDVVTVAGGAICGTLLSRMISDQGISVMFDYILIIIVFFGILIFHRHSRKLLMLSQAGAWEPGVDPERARETLQSDWRRKDVSIIWPSAAVEGGQRRPNFCSCLSHHFWWSALLCLPVPTILFFVWLNSSERNLERLWIVAAWLLANIASILISLWTTFSIGKSRTMRFYFRKIRLDAICEKKISLKVAEKSDSDCRGSLFEKMRLTFEIWKNN